MKYVRNMLEASSKYITRGNFFANPTCVNYASTCVNYASTCVIFTQVQKIGKKRK